MSGRPESVVPRPCGNINQRRKIMSMKLWYGPASPFVRKVMVFAHEVSLAGSIELATGDA